MAVVPRAVTLGETRGFVKILIDAGTDRTRGSPRLVLKQARLMAAVQTGMLSGPSYTVLRDAISRIPPLPKAWFFCYPLLRQKPCNTQPKLIPEIH